MAITKSLHTITAATMVAELLAADNRTIYRDATALAYKALAVLGHGPGSDTADPTWLRIVANCQKIIGAPRAATNPNSVALLARQAG